MTGSILASGKYTATPPTYTDGQEAPLHVGSRGALHVQVLNADGTAGADVAAAAGADTSSNTVDVMLTRAYNMGYNGTTWDRLRVGGSTTALALTVTDASDRYVVKTFTPSTVTGAQTAEDILFATEEITTVGLSTGKIVALHQIVVSDIDDQGDAQTLFWFNANTSLGTEGSVPDIDDTEILTCIGQSAIASGDWKDVGANRIATIRFNPPVRMATGASGSLWVAGNTQGTPTHTASGLQFQFTFERL